MGSLRQLASMIEHVHAEGALRRPPPEDDAILPPDIEQHLAVLIAEADAQPKA